ncbi:unnamed protein product [marine sediment metagenome]|uniref:Uncharacterized protein n=1 Tax=marine sediment metagenome TaxID=412755 RepID=X1MN00_9ZZZZ
MKKSKMVVLVATEEEAHSVAELLLGQRKAVYLYYFHLYYFLLSLFRTAPKGSATFYRNHQL